MTQLNLKCPACGEILRLYIRPEPTRHGGMMVQVACRNYVPRSEHYQKDLVWYNHEYWNLDSLNELIVEDE